MSTCIKWVNTITILCNNFAERIDHTCTSWADEGSSKCSEWADEGSNRCTSWQKCHWYTPWNCVAGFFCRAFYWVSKWVCKAYYWVSKWVCKIFAYFTILVCSSWTSLLKPICTAWDAITCGLKSLQNALASLMSGKKAVPPKIEHFFVLMLENRSYDHIFGFSNINGTDSVTGKPKTANGVDPLIHSNVNSDTAEVVAVKTPADYFLRDVDKDPGHSFGRTLTQLCGSNATYPDPVTARYPAIDNSGFVQTYASMHSNEPGRIMKCFSKEQLPVLNKLAEEFAVCDNWFSSLPGPTTPNRFFLLAGTSSGLIANPKPANLSVEDIISGVFGGFKFQNGHIFNELDSKCVDWAVFSGDNFPNCIMLDGMIFEHDPIRGRLKNMSDFATTVNAATLAEKFIFIEPKYNDGSEWNPTTHDYVCGNSMHPLDDVTRGEKLIKEVYETIRNSPHWEKSALVIVFDEHGGFYDHVKPPVAVPPGDLFAFSEDNFHFKYDQLGPRVPAVVVSPFIKKGTIDSKEYDHTSVLATARKLFGLSHLTERDKNAEHLLHLFSLPEARNDAPRTLPDIADSGFYCPEDKESKETLLALHAELTKAKVSGNFNKLKVDTLPLDDSELGFCWSALIQVMQHLSYKEKLAWTSAFKNIKTELDAVKFRTEVKLRTRYVEDFQMPADAQNEK
jgi:phospholipase C